MTSKFVEIQGLKTHYTLLSFSSTGDFHTKIPIIFLHGWSMEVSGKTFTRVAEPIAKKFNRPILLLDLPGFGQTDPPPMSGWGTEDYADWFFSFLKKLDIPQADFFGHSFGCRVLVRFLVHHQSMARKVVLTGAAGIRWPLSARQKLSIWLSKKGSVAKALMPSKLQKWMMTRIFGARDWGLSREIMKPTLRKVLEEPDFREVLPDISVPILLIWGEKDLITPLKSGEVYHQQLPNNKLKVILEGRHGIHKTHPEVIIDFVSDFLS